ncbi:MAG: transcriptional repressor LexA [Actinobacteria bacterium]|nr:transcriptional repressor LexA [Actinomycetota bacterium]
MEEKKHQLSQRQSEILGYIIDKTRESGYPPTVREIAKAVNLSSSATIHAHLKKLGEFGYIRRDSAKPRAIEVSKEVYDMFFHPGSSPARNKTNNNFFDNNTVLIPVLGRIAAGTPVLADENIEDYFPVSADFVKNNNEVFMLRVSGDSMVNAGILDRDYIIVKKQETAMNGEIVAALIEDEATVKRFFRKAKSIKLMPENDFMEPIELSDVKILGKVIGVIRKYF